MKNTNKLALLLMYVTFGFTIINCSSEDGGDDTQEDKNPTPVVLTPPTDGTPPTKEEEDKRTTITLEAESATLNSSWALKKDISGYSGDGYIQWEGQDLFWKGNQGGIGKLTYKIQVDAPGKYLFLWRSVIAKNNGESNATTEHNDSWLRFPDADDFYAFNWETKNKHYPNGSDKNPKGIAGESGNGFMKIFMNNLTWKELASTWDKKGYQVFVEFEKAGEYTIEVAPRSSFHAIDKMKLIPK